MQFGRRCCTVAIPDVRSPLLHHFPVFCRDGGNVQQDRRSIPVCQRGIWAVCGFFGGLDDVAFIYYWLGLGRKRFWALFRLFFSGRKWMAKQDNYYDSDSWVERHQFFGVKPGARTINFFTVGKLLSLLIFIGVGFFLSRSKI